MYKEIYVPVDNSDYSNQACVIGVDVARQFGGRVAGCHAYAAKMHDVRFRQMESGLPEEFRDEDEMKRQRKIHDQLITKGLEIITASTIRNHHNALNPRVKSLNYLNNIMAKIEAQRAGCAEAIMLNQLGEVAECTGDNIFFVKNGILRTPPSHSGIREGITREAVLELATSSDIPVEQVTLTRHDVYAADECFLTGTGAEVIPVVKCDNRVIGSGVPGPR